MIGTGLSVQVNDRAKRGSCNFDHARRPFRRGATFAKQVSPMKDMTRSASFFERRHAARQRLDALNPHRDGGVDEADPDRSRWFATIYDLAGDDPASIPWARLKPNALLLDWLTNAGSLQGLRALDVGCSIGDNAEAIASFGARVTAFDYVPKAISWAKQRYPDSSVDYCVADLFAPPESWEGAFDFVHECQTLQTVSPQLLEAASKRLASFVAPGGTLLIISCAREDGETYTTPWRPLSRAEIERVATDGLTLSKLDDLPPTDRSGRQWRAVFRRSSDAFGRGSQNPDPTK